MRKRVEAVYVGENGEPGISFKDYEKIIQDYDEGDTSAAIVLEFTAMAELSQRSLDAKVIMTMKTILIFFLA